MSTSFEIILALLLFSIPIILPSKYNKFFFLTSFIFILSSILFLDLSSYTSDLDRYSDPFHPLLYFYDYSKIDDYLFYKISDLIYKFFYDGKKIIIFWQLIIILNYFISELNIIYILKKLSINYTKGLFLFILFNTVGIQTIYNQLRYGVSFSIIVLITTLLIRYFILNNKKDIYLIFVLVVISFFIHKFTTIIFLGIPIIYFLIFNIKKKIRFNKFKIKILNFPIFYLIFFIALMSFSLIFKDSIILFISTAPLLSSIYHFRVAAIAIAQFNMIKIFSSVLFSFFNIYISYKAIFNTALKRYIPFMQIIIFMSMSSIIFLIIPLGTRLTSFMIFLPLPFYLAFNKQKSSYLFNFYYASLVFINIIRFESLLPSQ